MYGIEDNDLSFEVLPPIILLFNFGTCSDFVNNPQFKV